MPEVELSNGQVLEFPEGMSQEEMHAAIQKNFPKPKPEQPYTPGGLAGPLIAKGLHAGKVGLQDIGNALGNVGRGIDPFAREVMQEPGRAAMNVGATVPRTFGDIARTSGDLPGLLAHFGLIKPETAENVNKGSGIVNGKMNLSSPVLGNGQNLEALTNKIGQMTGPSSNPENEAVQKGLESLLGLSPFAKTGAKATLGTGKAAISGLKKGASIPGKIIGKTDPVAAAQDAALQLQMPGHQEAVQQAEQQMAGADQQRRAFEEQHANVEAEQKAATEEAQKEIGKSNPNLLEYNITQQNEKLNQIKDNTKELESKLAEFKPIEPYANEDLSHLEQHEQAIDKVNEAERNINNAELNHEHAHELYTNAEQDVGRHLNEGSDYPVNTSREMKNEIGSIEGYYKDSYKNLTNKLKNTHFQLLNPQRIGTAIQDALEVAKRDFGEDPNGEFARVLQKAPGVKDTSASAYMNKQKDFRDARYDLLQRAKSEQSAVKRDELFKAYRALKPFEDFINDALAEGLGQYRPFYEDIMRGYREQVYPLRENSVASKIMEGKPMSANIAGELAGDQEGQQLLRDLAKRNDQVKRNIIGQQYAKDKNNVYNPDERILEYTQEMPSSFHRMLDTRNEALNAAEGAKSNIETAKANHKIAEDEAKIAKKHAEETEKEKAALSKENQAKIDKQEKAIADIKKAIENNEASVKELEIDNAKKEKHMNALREAKNKTQLSLKDKFKLETEHDKARNDVAKAKKEMTELKRQVAENKRKLRESTTGLKKLYMNAKTIVKIGGKLAGVL